MTHIDTQETLAANRRYFKGAMKVPLLEQERELELARLWRQEQNEKALHELTSAHLRLVIAMATKFRHYGLPMGDLVQEGNIGLMQAADRFDIERGVRFSTYASWWIRASIQDFILRNWSIVRTGTTAAQKSLFFNLRRLRARINDGGQNNMTHESRLYIAKELGVRLEDVETMEGRLSGNDRSLNAPMSEADGEANSLEWQDLLVCDSPLPDEVVSEDKDSEVRSNWIKDAMASLIQLLRTSLSLSSLTTSSGRGLSQTNKSCHSRLLASPSASDIGAFRLLSFPDRRPSIVSTSSSLTPSSLAM